MKLILHIFLLLMLLPCSLNATVPSVASVAGVSGVISVADGKTLDLSDEQRTFLEKKGRLIVGYSPGSPPFLVETGPGEYGGLMVDAYRLVGEKLGVEVEFVFGDWPDILDRLGRGEIDVVGSMSEEVAKERGFLCVEPLFTNSFVIYSLDDSRGYNRDDSVRPFNALADLAGKKVAYQERIIIFGRLLADPKLNIRPLAVESDIAGLNLLQSGQADAFLGLNNTMYQLSKRMITNIHAGHILTGVRATTVAATRPGDPELQAIIAKAHSGITASEKQELSEKWFGRFEPLPLRERLSSEDQSFLEKHPRFTVCNQYDLYPHTGYSNGRITGISGQVLDEIASRLGITFTGRDVSSYQDLNDKVASGQCDLVSAIARNTTRFPRMKPTRVIRTTYFASLGNLRSTFLDIPNLSATGQNSHRFLVRYQAYKALVLQHYPQLQVEVVADLDRIMEQVLRDSSFHFVGTRQGIDLTIQSYGFDRFKRDGVLENVVIEGAMGVHEKYPELLRLVNTALEEIGPEKIRAIGDRYELKGFTVVSHNTGLKMMLGLAGLVITVLALRYVMMQREKTALAQRIAKELTAERMALTQVSTVGLIHVRDRRFLWTNDRFCELVGYSREELIGQSTRLIYAEEDDFTRNADVYTSKGQAIGSHMGELEIRRKDGTTLLVRFALNGVESDGGSHRELMGVVIDITEEKQREQQLSELRRQQEAILSNKNVGLCLVRDLKLVWVNDRMAEIYGYAPEELIGQSPRIFYESDEAFAENFVNLQEARDGGSTVFESREIKKDGTPVNTRISMTFTDPADLQSYTVAIEDITERIAAQKELERTYTESQLAQSAGGVAVFMYHFGARPDYWSDSFYELFGFDRDYDAPSKELAFTRFDTADQKTLDNVLPLLMQNQQPITVEVTLRREDCAPKIVRIHHALFETGHDGQFLAGSIVDITELKTLQQKQEALLNTQSAGLIMARHRKFTWVNKTFCDMIGYTADELIGQDSHIIYPSLEEYESTGRHVLPQTVHRGMNETEMQFKCKDGTIIDVYGAGRMVGDPANGEVLATVIDISDRVKAQRELAALNATLEERIEKATVALVDKNSMLQMTLDLSSIISFKVDLPAFLAEHDNSLNHFFEVEPDRQITFEQFLTYVHPEDRERAEQEFEAAFSRMEDYEITYRILTPKNNVKYIVNKASVGRDRVGTPVAIYVSLQDVTATVLAAQKEKEQEVLLMQQNRLALQGEMLEMIAHQWRQPLNNLSILLQGFFIQLRMEKDLQLSYAETKQKSLHLIQHMSQTIADFTNFFKTNKSPTDFVLGEVVEETLHLLQPRLDKFEIVIDRKEDRAAGEQLHSFRSELGQAFMAILNNGIDALMAREGGRLIAIRSRREGDMVVVCFADNGGGIAEKILPRIFEPYMSTKQAIQGTGLGLYMTRMMVEKSLGGQIEAGNEGHGAIFEITLPLQLERAAEETSGNGGELSEGDVRKKQDSDA